MGFGWVIDHVSPLNTWLEELTGDADQVTAFAATWANVSTSMQDSADELTRIVAADLEAMDGATIAAYRAVADDMARHLGGASRWAGAMSTALGVATTLVQIVHDLVRDAIAQVLGAVASFATELVCTVGLAAPLVIEQATTRAASLATRIGKHLTNLLSSFHSLEGMLRDLRRLLDDLGDEFGKLFRRGGGGESTGKGATSPHPGGPDAAEASAPHPGAPAHSGPHLPKGATSIADDAPDPHFGSPQAESGTTVKSWYEVPTTATDDVAALGGDAAHPWGTNPDSGLPYTKDEFYERFVEPDGEVHWPPNGGAVPGTRHAFASADDFTATYGDQLDRIGGTTGKYLGIPPGAPYGERALFPSSLGQPVHDYRFSGTLPDGWKIEVSQIAPAFGQPGGAMQILVKDEDGLVRSVDDLLAKHVLEDKPR